MDVTGDRRMPSNANRNSELPEAPVMASGGTMGRGASCKGASSSLGVQGVKVEETQWTLFGMGPDGEGAHLHSAVGEKAMGER